MHAAAPSSMALPMRRAVEAKLLYEYDNVPSAAVRTAEQAVQRSAGRTASSRTKRRSRRSTRAAACRKIRTSSTACCWRRGTSRPGSWTFPRNGCAACRTRAAPAASRRGCGSRRSPRRSTPPCAPGTPDALCRAARRCLRYRGEQDAQRLAQRYGRAGGGGPGARWSPCAARGSPSCTGRATRTGRSSPARSRRRCACGARRLRPCRGSGLRRCWPPRSARPARRRRSCAPRWTACSASSTRSPRGRGSLLLPARVANYRPALLDGLLAAGEYSWTLRGGEAAFFRAQDVDWDAEPEAPAGFAPAEGRIAPPGRAAPPRGELFQRAVRAAGREERLGAAAAPGAGRARARGQLRAPARPARGAAGGPRAG